MNNQQKSILKTIIPAWAIKLARRSQIAIALSDLDPNSGATLVAQARNLSKIYSSINSVEDLVSKYKATSGNLTISLDLGCGVNPRNPFAATNTHGVDIRSDLANEIRQADLSVEPIPYESNFLDFCTAFDVLEHIPRLSWQNGTSRLAFLELMNEIHRVLKPGGLFLHSTPAYPSKQAFQDPTHTNMITEDTIPLYFCEPANLAKKLGYGFQGSFELVEQRWLDNSHVVGILKAIK